MLHSSFLDDRAQRQDTAISHAAIDNARQSTSREGQPLIIVPYFPAGLARSPEQRTDFNFTSFVFDTLHLPCGLFASDAGEEVQFEDLQRCREYCKRFMAEREEWCGLQESAPDQSQQMRSQLSKDTIFHQAGLALGAKLKSKNPAWDRHLKDLRLDIFGNVMFLKAPHWSDISTQFMHGFPRRLIVQHHRGILPGNITVAACISNQAVRSLSTGKINNNY